jgi:predicted secreted Zn-dependent protease
VGFIVKGTIMTEEFKPTWTKSSRCGSGTCVEVARVQDTYLVRDSKNPDAAALSFTKEEWVAFVEGVTAGEFRF